MDDRRIQAERRQGLADRRARGERRAGHGFEGESRRGSGPGASTYGGLAGEAPGEEHTPDSDDGRRRGEPTGDPGGDDGTWRQERYRNASEEFNEWRAARNADANPSNASSTSAPFPETRRG